MKSQILASQNGSMITKITKFRELFKGRTDVVPRYWKSKGGASGYSPMCQNEWKENVCQKPCRSCQNANYIPLSDDLLLNHFKGNHILGAYPLIKNHKCNFIAADFDDHSGDRDPISDVKAYYETCQIQEIPIYVLRSKSGKGYHAYIFYKKPVPAWKARIVTFALLQEAQVIGDDVEISSFDRLFPNQDELSGKGFGNLIGLPFQGQAAKQGHTLLLDSENGFEKPYTDQWAVLRDVGKIDESILDGLIDEWNLKQEKVSTSGYDRSRPKSENTDKILECGFVKWCKGNPEKVSEPLWYALISNLIRVKGGYSLSHELSNPYPGYSQEDTDKKIHQAMDRTDPMTCAYIRNNGFNCNRFCGVKSPIGLLFRSRKNFEDNQGPREWIPYEKIREV